MNTEDMLIKHLNVSIEELEQHAEFLSTLGPELTIPGFDAGKMCGIFMAVGFFKQVLLMHANKTLESTAEAVNFRDIREKISQNP